MPTVKGSVGSTVMSLYLREQHGRIHRLGRQLYLSDTADLLNAIEVLERAEEFIAQNLLQEREGRFCSSLLFF